jgi:hypothetical protein
MDPNMEADSGTILVGNGVDFTPMDAAILDEDDTFLLNLLALYGGRVTKHALFLTIRRSGNVSEPVVNWLIDHGADVNADVDPWGLILHWAIERGAWPLVQILLNRGADIERRCRGTGMNALGRAQLEGDQRLVDMIKGHAKGGASGAKE